MIVVVVPDPGKEDVWTQATACIGAVKEVGIGQFDRMLESVVWADDAPAPSVGR